MSAGKRAVLVRRLICNAMVVIAATAVFGFKAVERGALAGAAPIEIASR